MPHTSSSVVHVQLAHACQFLIVTFMAAEATCRHGYRSPICEAKLAKREVQSKTWARTPPPTAGAAPMVWFLLVMMIHVGGVLIHGTSTCVVAGAGCGVTGDPPSSTRRGRFPGSQLGILSRREREMQGSRRESHSSVLPDGRDALGSTVPSDPVGDSHTGRRPAVQA